MRVEGLGFRGLGCRIYPEEVPLTYSEYGPYIRLEDRYKSPPQTQGNIPYKAVEAWGFGVFRGLWGVWGI